MKIIILLILSLGFFVQPAEATVRSEKAKATFKYLNPCPVNGHQRGACPGYVIDHIKALACGGLDVPGNMQWQTVQDGKAKDKVERQGCRKSTAKTYHTGKRGGCFVSSASGNKRYVAGSYCGHSKLIVEKK